MRNRDDSTGTTGYAIHSARILSISLCGVGATGAAVALGLDLIAQGTPGFGRGQMALLLAGLALFAIGLDSSPGAVRSALTDALAAPRQHLAAIAKYAVILLQLVLMLVVVRQFSIENPSFHELVAALVVGGFAVHYFLPPSARLTFFATLSLSAVWIVFGAAGAPWLIAIGIALIALCHLPVRFGVRIVLILGCGAVLAAARAEWFQAPFPSAIWPILGSMFMFRLIVYMYDLRHSAEPFNWRRSVAYFFMLPNVVFPLFPVVDWSTFRRTYYDRERHWIYQRGVQWIFRGITHLLAYRLVYQTMLIPAEEVATTADLGRFMLATFLLYLRVSGQFHLIVGLMHLFGFRLPETHRLFYFASSFTDFWRRINIYWKDFMMKVVFYPALFRLKRLGQTTSIVLATLLVFVATWALHAYQWFWLLGDLLLTWPDVLFWVILALLLIANSLFELRHGRRRTLGTSRVSAATIVPRVLSTAVTFTVICVLWSLWSSHSIGEWVSLWGVLGQPEVGRSSVSGLEGIVAIGAGMVASSGTHAIPPLPPGRPGGAKGPTFTAVALRTLGAAVLVAALGKPEIAARLGGTVGGALRDLRSPQLSEADQEVMRRGYYENLTAPNPLNAALFDVYSRPVSKQEWPGVEEAGLARRTSDALRLELLPLRGAVFHGSLLRTNRWGMRDADYSRLKPPNSYRIALLGASYVMGDGVADNETFEAVLESRLAHDRRPSDLKIEILNFATPSYLPLRYLVQLHRKVLAFQPDAVFMVSHASDAMDVPVVIAESVGELDSPPLDFLQPILDSLGIDLALHTEALELALRPHQDLLLERTYSRIVGDLRARGVLPVWIHVPTPNIDPTDERISRNEAMAVRAGFLTIDVRDAYAGTDPRTLWIATWDYHPNAEGHRRIADNLHTALMSRLDQIPLRSRTTLRPSESSVPAAQAGQAPSPDKPKVEVQKQ